MGELSCVEEIYAEMILEFITRIFFGGNCFGCCLFDSGFRFSGFYLITYYTLWFLINEHYFSKLTCLSSRKIIALSPYYLIIFRANEHPAWSKTNSKMRPDTVSLQRIASHPLCGLSFLFDTNHNHLFRWNP